MTSPSVDASSAPAAVAQPAPLWEDFIDIFHAPSSVFERRRDANPWPMILILTALILALSVLTFNSLSPVIEPVMRRAMEKAAASNPQLTQDMIETQMRVSMKVAPWFPLLTPIFMLVGALIVWLVGKIFSSKANYTQSLLIVAYASITFVVGYLITGAQTLLMDTTKLTNPVQLSLSPARFVDATKTSPWLLGFLMTIDLIGLWRLALLAIGLRVIGRISRNAAWAFAVIAFVLIFLMSVRNAMQMAG